MTITWIHFFTLHWILQTFELDLEIIVVLAWFSFDWTYLTLTLVEEDKINAQLLAPDLFLVQQGEEKSTTSIQPIFDGKGSSTSCSPSNTTLKSPNLKTQSSHIGVHHLRHNSKVLCHQSLRVWMWCPQHVYAFHRWQCRLMYTE